MTLYEEALMMLDEAKRRIVAQSITDDAIVELVEEAVKRIQADHDAMMCEWTTDRENARIRKAQHDTRVRWGASDDYR